MHTNTQIVSLTQKFESIEEIYATYVGMLLLPTETRNTVNPSIKHALEARNWYTAYTSLVYACENCNVNTPFDAACIILNRVYRIIEHIDIDSAYILDKISQISKVIWLHSKLKDSIKRDELNRDAIKEIDIILKKAGIPNELFWSVSATIDAVTPQLDRLYEAVNSGCLHEEDRELLLSYPVIILVGRASWKDITPFILLDSLKEDWNNLSTTQRFFSESLRQQLSQRCGIACPFAYTINRENVPCCGLKQKALQIL